MAYNFDIIVIGGGPAGYAAAIRAGQLKKRVLCIEKENLGGTCLNWGCIPTKALLDAGAFVRKVRTHAGDYGVTCENVKVDFNKIIARSRAIADKLAKGIAHLFRKYEVKHEVGVGQLLALHKVKVTGKKETDKLYHRHPRAGFPGALKTTNLEKLRARHPEDIVKNAVRRMLPRNALGRQMMTKLKVYADDKHPHVAQKPAARQVEA